MKETLTSSAGRESLKKVLSARGFVYEESGRLTQTGVVFTCLVARTARAITSREGTTSVAIRFRNSMDDLCSLGVITVAQVPSKPEIEAALAEEEIKCVGVWDSYYNVPWGGLATSGIVSPGTQEVIDENYVRWEFDFLLALRLFAYFRRLAPVGWTWNANHITLVWKNQLPLIDNYLLPRLVEEISKFQVKSGRGGDAEAFPNALRGAFEAFIRMRKYQLGSGPATPPGKGFLAFLKRPKVASTHSFPELLQEFDERMGTLCSIIGFV